MERTKNVRVTVTLPVQPLLFPAETEYNLSRCMCSRLSNTESASCRDMRLSLATGSAACKVPARRTQKSNWISGQPRHRSNLTSHWSPMGSFLLAPPHPLPQWFGLNPNPQVSFLPQVLKRRHFMLVAYLHIRHVNWKWATSLLLAQLI